MKNKKTQGSCKIMGCYMKMATILEKCFMPLMMLGIRLWMANIFWKSGLTKISNWASTIELFRDEYKVPIIPPEIAAYISTSVELGCPVLLAFGFATRLAAIPMLCMTAVINITYPGFIEHAYWAMLLGVIICYGPGCLSVDNLIRKKCAACK